MRATTLHCSSALVRGWWSDGFETPRSCDAVDAATARHLLHRGMPRRALCSGAVQSIACSACPRSCRRCLVVRLRRSALHGIHLAAECRLSHWASPTQIQSSPVRRLPPRVLACLVALARSTRVRERGGDESTGRSVPRTGRGKDAMWGTALPAIAVRLACDSRSLLCSGDGRISGRRSAAPSASTRAGTPAVAVGDRWACEEPQVGCRGRCGWFASACCWLHASKTWSRVAATLIAALAASTAP